MFQLVRSLYSPIISEVSRGWRHCASVLAWAPQIPVRIVGIVATFPCTLITCERRPRSSWMYCALSATANIGTDT